MKLPLSWLKEYVDVTLPVEELCHRLTMAGLEAAPADGGRVLEVEVTPNRPDWLSVMGVAREVAALSSGRIREPDTAYREEGPPIGQRVEITIADPDLCHRYSASLVTGVRVGPSPSWMQERLLAAGMRPINNIVDITNYVMMEHGQPLHAFDGEKIGGGKVIIRRARQGEKLTTLDGANRALLPDMLVIADEKEAIAVAGVMGGADTEVSEDTTAILLESANFQGFSVRRTSGKLNLRTEASIRFEKGISAGLTVPALRRATRMILETAGGQAAQGVIDEYPIKEVREAIPLSVEQLHRILGVDWPMARVCQALTALGFDWEERDGQFLVHPPIYRTDVRLAEDVVEEVARIVGYDAIPTTMLRGQLPPQRFDPLRILEEEARDVLVGCGLQEVITYTLTSASSLERVGTPAREAIRLANPMSREQEYLRPTLRASLLSALATNQRYGEEGVWLFEVGKVFSPREGDLPEERRMLGGIIYGPQAERSWLLRPKEADFFDARGLVEALLERLGARAEFQPFEEAFFIPGRAARVLVAGSPLGVLGEVHPAVRESFELRPKTVCLLEIDLEGLLPHTRSLRRFQELPRYPPVSRDLSIVVDEGIPAGRVLEVILSFPLVRRALLFDVYTGDPLPQGKRALAYSLLYQSPQRTLTDQEVKEVERQILERLAGELGAVLRT